MSFYRDLEITSFLEISEGGKKKSSSNSKKKKTKPHGTSQPKKSNASSPTTGMSSTQMEKINNQAATQRAAAAAQKKKEKESANWDKLHAAETNSKKPTVSGGTVTVGMSGKSPTIGVSIDVNTQDKTQQCGGCHNGNGKPTGTNAWTGGPLTPASSDYIPNDKR